MLVGWGGVRGLDLQWRKGLSEHGSRKKEGTAFDYYFFFLSPHVRVPLCMTPRVRWQQWWGG
jgi:hypothetical protein